MRSEDCWGLQFSGSRSRKKGDSDASYTTIHPSLHISRHYFPHRSFADRNFCPIVRAHMKKTLNNACAQQTNNGHSCTHTKSIASLEAEAGDTQPHAHVVCDTGGKETLRVTD